jgi:hypothetical protein
VIRGDAMRGIEAMGQLQSTLRRLAEVPRKLAAEAKPGIDRLLREQFRNGTDPYGRPWAPVTPQTLARRKMSRATTPLTDTGVLSSGTVAVTHGSRVGLSIVVGAPYGYFHQVGFRVGRTQVKARKILPEYGIPLTWKIVLREATTRLTRRAVGKS